MGKASRSRLCETGELKSQSGRREEEGDGEKHSEDGKRKMEREGKQLLEKRECASLPLDKKPE